MEKPSPQFVKELKVLQKMLTSFVITYKKIDPKRAHKEYLAKANDSLSLLKIITPIIKEAEEEVTPNCPPSDIPTSVTKHDRAEGIELLNSKISYIKKHKEDYESYLLNCFGIQLNWKNGLPSPNTQSSSFYQKLALKMYFSCSFIYKYLIINQVINLQ